MWTCTLLYYYLLRINLVVHTLIVPIAYYCLHFIHRVFPYMLFALYECVLCCYKCKQFPVLTPVSAGSLQIACLLLVAPLCTTQQAPGPAINFSTCRDFYLTYFSRKRKWRIRWKFACSSYSNNNKQPFICECECVCASTLYIYSIWRNLLNWWAKMERYGGCNLIKGNERRQKLIEIEKKRAILIPLSGLMTNSKGTYSSNLI